MLTDDIGVIGRSARILAIVIASLASMTAGPIASARAHLTINATGPSFTELTIQGDSGEQDLDIAVEDAPGEGLAHRVTIDPHGESWASSAPLVDGCGTLSGGRFRCDAPVGAISVDLGAGNDRVDYSRNPSQGYDFAPRIILGFGDDVVTGTGDTAVTADLGSGTDTADMSSLTGFRSQVTAGDGRKTISGSAATRSLGSGDRVYFKSRSTGVTVDLQAGTLSDGGTITGVEEVEGTRFGDVLKGDAQSNWLTGADGADSIEGRGGADEIDADEEQQSVEVTTGPTGLTRQALTTAASADTVDCGEATDRVRADSLDQLSACEQRSPSIDGLLSVSRDTAAAGDTLTLVSPSVWNPDGITLPGGQPSVGWTPLITCGDNICADFLNSVQGATYTVRPEDRAVTAFYEFRLGDPFLISDSRTVTVMITGVTAPPPAPPSGQNPTTPAPSDPTPSPSGPVAVPPVEGTGPVTAPPAPKPAPAKQTKAQKLAAALKKCRKLRSKSKRRNCERTARAKYGPARKPKR